ncbi:DNA repair protein RadC [Neptunomonas phycophila]|uniref:DNA repair protein RadC n=1 Tax=Neptunomonas phycophila TaxID=1572645 RepID=A0AAW7XR80_9GAMM|nr:DNA repair protein RadC [Neptunomonas phycophila]MDO6455295.1 DNA repair protein RadC [Neptunomonas phycophila]MDO6785827.1 DNA repair protein RadC [Neptunomonas phycophila]
MAITDWPELERPREKLLHHGAAVLSDAELLAIFLRTGIKGTSAVDLSRDLLQRFGGLRELLESSQEAFCQGPGLGNAKYAQLQAVLEMSRRHLLASLERGDVMESPSAVRRFLSAKMRHYRQEVFACLFMDNKHRIIRFEPMFFGTIDAASVYPREVVRKALEVNAAAVILTHNHPSGIAEPSAADRHITERLVNALQLVDVRVLDHMVIGDPEVVSFAERGLM